MALHLFFEIGDVKVSCTRLCDLPGPTDEEVLAVTQKVARRVLALLPREDDDEEMANSQDALSAAQTEALFAVAAPATKEKRAENLTHRRCARVDGFSLHANVRIGAKDRDGLERLCRYGARPAFSQKRLSLTDDGRVSYRLKRPWPDGRLHITMEPVAFLRRIAGIIPPPRFHLTRYAGILSPNAKHRAQALALVPPGPRDSPITPSRPMAKKGASRRRLPWADLLERVFAVDVLACPCGGRRRVLAFITDPNAIRSILASLLASICPPTCPRPHPLAPRRRSPLTKSGSSGPRAKLRRATTTPQTRFPPTKTTRASDRRPHSDRRTPLPARRGAAPIRCLPLHDGSPKLPQEYAPTSALRTGLWPDGLKCRLNGLEAVIR